MSVGNHYTVAIQVYEHLKDLGVQGLTGDGLDMACIDVRDDKGSYFLCFYNMIDYKSKDLDPRWTVYEYNKTLEEGRVVFSDLKSSEASAEDVIQHVVTYLSNYGLIPSRSMFKPRKVYPADEQQELCL